MIGRILRLVALTIAVADRDEERSRPVEDQPGTEMHVAGDRRHLLKITLVPSSAVPRSLRRARATLVPVPPERGSAKER